MTTFRIPSLMVDSGLVAAPRSSGASHHQYGDGWHATDVLNHCDALFAALTFSGYHAEQIYLVPGTSLQGETLTFPYLEHLDYSIGTVDWQAKVGMPAPAPDATTLAIVVTERTRYDGIGPTFAVPLPTLSALGSIPGPAGETCVVTVSTTTGIEGGDVVRVVCLELRVPADDITWYGRMAALDAVVPTVVATIQSDLIVAAGSDWHLDPGSSAQAGLLPMFIAPAWRHSKPWLLDEHSALIDSLGSEIFAALESEELTTAELVASELFETWTFGELLARVRRIPVPPAIAADVSAALNARLAVVSGSLYPPIGGPLDAVDQRSFGRMLMLAHELRILDVLGASSAADDAADVAAVHPFRIDLDVTGFYESRWNGWEGHASAINALNADWIGCLQINQVGGAITGWWQARNFRDRPARDHIATTQWRFAAEIHDDSDPDRPVLRFNAVDEPWEGLMKFDHSASATWPLLVLFGAVSDGSNSVPEIVVPDSMCTRRDYARINTRPHLHPGAISSLPAATETLVLALDRYPLHELERRNVDAAASELRSWVQSWLSSAPGGFKTGTAMDADHALLAAFGKYMHADDRSHVLASMKHRLRQQLYAQVVETGGGRYSAYNQTVNMVNQQVLQTPTIAELLDLEPLVLDDDTAYIYDWELATVGVATDLPTSPIVVPVGAGGFTGNMSITKRRGGVLEWSESFWATLTEGSTGLSAGATFTKVTTGTIVTNASWEPEDFTGNFEMEGAESGAFVFRWGWGGRITFYGNGNNPPLSGSASGLNWAIGPSAAALDVGIAGGVLAFGVDVTPPVLDPSMIEAYSARHTSVSDHVDAPAFFDVGSSVVRSEFVPELERACAHHLAAFMSPHGRFIVAGYASAPGTEAFNEDLSRRRAQAVTESIRVLLGDRLLVPEENTLIRAWGESQASGGPDGPELQEERNVTLILSAGMMIGY